MGEIMKIGIQTWGSDGDIRPLIALAAGLKNAGHDVTMTITSVDNKNYGSLGETLNIEINHIGQIDHDKDAIKKFGYEVIRISDPLKQLCLILDKLFKPAVKEMHEASKKLCKENDIVIGHCLIYSLGIEAEKSGKPNIMVHPTGTTIPSKYITPVGVPNLGNFMNSVFWKIGELIMNILFKPDVNRMRIQEGLAPIKNIVKEAMCSANLNLMAVSPTLFPAPPDWATHNYVCGFFNIPDHGEPWQMPADLKDFLDSGPSPVYITFGSMTLIDPSIQETVRLVIEAVKFAGCRAIIQTEWNECPGIPENPDIYRITKIPHQHIFPHCELIIHHGGAGTTQAASISGCPSIVVAYGVDQESWGIILRKSGIAPKVLHRRNLTAEKLAQRIKQVRNSPEMKERARKIKSSMQNENGVKRAVGIIESRFCRQTN